MKQVGALIAITFMALSGQAYAEEVAVLYGSGIPKSYQTQHFLDVELKALKSSYVLKPQYKPEDFQFHSQQKTVVISNDSAQGVEPKLAALLNSWPDKTNVVLVMLAKGAKSLSVETQSAAASSNGVDTISAATAWDEGSVVVRLFGGDRPKAYKMHEEWVRELVALLDSWK